MDDYNRAHAATYALMAMRTIGDQRNVSLDALNPGLAAIRDSKVEPKEPDNITPIFWPPDSTLTAFQRVRVHRDGR